MIGVWLGKACDSDYLVRILSEKVCQMFRARLLTVALIGVLAATLPVLGQTGRIAPMAVPIGDNLMRLTDVLLIDEIIGVMRDEGIDYGNQMEQELFARRGGGSWARDVNLIYDPVVMRRQFDAAFTADLAGDPAAVAAILSFFSSAPGQKIPALEVEARRVLIDPSVEDAAKATVEDMRGKGDLRIVALQRFAEVNDLIELNVSGALNSNLAFFQGLTEAGGPGDKMTEDQMLSEVWAQEPAIREETEGWLFPYLALAYGPLSNDELEAYVAFSATKPGQKLNQALFAAFDEVFTTASRDLGRAAGRQLLGEDI